MLLLRSPNPTYRDRRDVFAVGGWVDVVVMAAEFLVAEQRFRVEAEIQQAVQGMLDEADVFDRVRTMESTMGAYSVTARRAGSDTDLNSSRIVLSEGSFVSLRRWAERRTPGWR